MRILKIQFAFNINMNKQNGKQGGAGYPAYNPSSNQKNKKTSNINDPYKS